MDELERKEQELKEAMDEITRNGFILAESFERMDESTEDAEKRLRDFVRTSRDVGRQFGRIGRDLDSQKGKVGAFASSAELAAMAGSGLAKSLGVAGEVADLAADALMAIANITFEEVDRTIANFDKVGQVGAISAGGLEQFRTTAHGARLTMEQFSNVVAKSASNLAISTGNTLEGSRAISQLAAAAGENGLRLQLSMLGVGVEEQSEYFADYLMMQRRLGRQQNRDYRSQSQAAGEYVKQLVILAGLTGKSVDEAKRDLDAQLANTRFRAAMAAAEARGVDTLKLRAEMGAITARLPDMANGLMDAFSGANTDAAKEAFIMFRDVPGGLQNLITRFKSGEMAAGEFSKILYESGTSFKQAIGPDMIGTIYGTNAGLNNVMTTLLDINKLQDINPEAIAQYAQQISNLSEGSNEMTKNLKEAALNSQDSAVALESVKDIFLGLGDAVLGPFSSAVLSATKALNGLSKFVFELNENSAGTIEIEGRATGGPVTGGQPYVVGEQGPEIILPDSDSTVLNAKQAQSLFDMIQKSKTGIQFGGHSKGFLPGIGFIDRFTHAGGQVDRLSGFKGEILAETNKYMANALTAMQIKTGDQTFRSGKYMYGDLSLEQGMFATSGPSSYYDSIMSGVSPVEGTKVVDRTDYGNQKILDTSNEKLLEIQQQMVNMLSSIATNTKNGADTSKQLLRSTAG